MKKIIILMSAVLLPACYNITFDPIEYDRYVAIKLLADKTVSSCGTSEASTRVNELKQTADHQLLYSTNRSNRPQIAQSARELQSIIDGLYVSYQDNTPSTVYCREKLHNISEGTSKIIRELGRF